METMNPNPNPPGPSIKLAVEIDLGPTDWEQGFDPETGPWREPPSTLQQAIIAHAGRELLRMVEKEVREGLRERLRRIADAELAELIRPRLVKLVSNPLTYHPGGYGEGTKRTLEDVALEWLTKPTRGHGTTSGIQEIAKEVATRHLETAAKELSKAVDEAKAEMKKAFAEKVAESAARILGIRV